MSQQRKWSVKYFNLKGHHKIRLLFNESFINLLVETTTNEKQQQQVFPPQLHLSFENKRRDMRPIIYICIYKSNEHKANKVKTVSKI